MAILGCGNVGRALARALAGVGGWRKFVSFRGDVVVWSRSRRSTRKCLEEVAGWSPRPARRPVHAGGSLEEAVTEADVVLLCVAESALPDVIRATVRATSRQRRKPVLLVASGFQALAPLRRSLAPGVALGRLHPLAPFPEDGLIISRTHFAIEGDPRAVRTARLVMGWLDGRELELRPGNTARYHAGAALFGGGLVALFALAEAVMAPAVRSREALRRALYSFAGANAVHATGPGGPRRALTGPLARGSEATVRLHLRELRAVPEARAAYRQLGRTMLALARARGSIDAATERRLRRLLSGARRAR